MGLEPVMMFSGIYPEAKDGLEVLTQRIKQAGAAGVPQVLTFGHTKGGNQQALGRAIQATRSDCEG